MNDNSNDIYCCCCCNMVILNGDANRFLSLSDISPEWVVDTQHISRESALFSAVCVCVCVCVCMWSLSDHHLLCVCKLKRLCVCLCVSLSLCVSLFRGRWFTPSSIIPAARTPSTRWSRWCTQTSARTRAPWHVTGQTGQMGGLVG